MLDKFTLMLLVNQPGLIQSPRMFAYSFNVSADGCDNIFKSYPLAPGNGKQYLNPVMIRHALEVTLHLFRCFNFCHIYTIHFIPTFSLQRRAGKFVRMLVSEGFTVTLNVVLLVVLGRMVLGVPLVRIVIFLVNQVHPG